MCIVIILTIIFTDKSFSSFKSEFSNAFNISISLFLAQNEIIESFVRDNGWNCDSLRKTFSLK